MEQLLKELTQKHTFLYLLLVSSVDLKSKVKIGGRLGHSDHKGIEFKISVDRKENVNKTSTLNIRRADLRLFWELVN